MADFDRDILTALEALFNEGEVETLVFRTDCDQSTQDTAVKVVHRATGKESVSSEFESQIKNKSMALIGLLAALHSK